MAKRSTRKRIIAQFDGMERDLASVAMRARKVLDMCNGRPPEVMRVAATLAGAVKPLINIVNGGRSLYTGSAPSSHGRGNPEAVGVEPDNGD